MWQLFSFGAIAADVVEHLVDKVVMIKDKRRDAVLAAFQRTFAFWAFAISGGLLGIFGTLDLVFIWPIFLLAAMWMIASVGYSYILKNVELTGYSAIHYVIPFFFLIADVFIFRSGMSMAQIAGVILLVMGGLLFVVDFRTREVRRIYTKLAWFILGFDVILYGSEYYIFKHLYDTIGLNEVSYIASIWTLMVIGFPLLITIQGKWSEMPQAARQDGYLWKSFVSKGIDFVSSMLWLRAATFVDVSRVTAMGSFAPLAFLVGVYVTQNFLKIPVDEEFRKGLLTQKVLATVLLCLGGYIAR